MTIDTKMSAAKTHTGLKIRATRLGITLRDLCKRAGVLENTISRWAEKDPKSLEAYHKLTEVLDELETKTVHKKTVEGSNGNA